MANALFGGSVVAADATSPPVPDLRESGAPLVANLGAWRNAWENAWATEETQSSP